MLRIIVSFWAIFSLTSLPILAEPQSQGTDYEESILPDTFKEITSDKSSDDVDAEIFVEKAYQYIEDRKDIFRLENPREELILKRAITTPPLRNKTVIFSYIVKGVKVLGAGYTIRLRPDGKIYDFKGMIYPEAKKVDTSPKISNQQAMNIALGDAEEPHPKAPAQRVKDPELLIAKFNDKFKLVWLTGIFHYYPSRDYYIYIDAKTGEIKKNGQ